MPVKLSNSSVIKWPDKQTVDRAVRAWAEQIAVRHADVVRVGYFGSYARGDWGVGSDVDVLVLVRVCQTPFERRGILWNAMELPVHADVLVYTLAEWASLDAASRWRRTLEDEVVWIDGCGGSSAV